MGTLRLAGHFDVNVWRKIRSSDGLEFEVMLLPRMPNDVWFFEIHCLGQGANLEITWREILEYRVDPLNYVFDRLKLEAAELYAKAEKLAEQAALEEQEAEQKKALHERTVELMARYTDVYGVPIVVDPFPPDEVSKIDDTVIGRATGLEKLPSQTDQLPPGKGVPDRD